MQRTLRRLLFTLCMLTPVLASSAVSAQETQDTTKLPAAMRTARATLTAAFLALNAANASPFFADTALVNFGGEVVQGKANVDNWLAAQMAGLSAIKFALTGFTVSDTQVTERSSYTVTVRDGGGEQSGTNEVVWLKQANGAWKVIRMTIM